MEPSFNFPHDDYALAILTHAAMQTDHETSHSNNTNTTNNSHSSSSGYNRSTALTRADIPSNSSPSISNHTSDLGNNRTQDLTRGNTDILSSYSSAAPSVRGMETLAFNPGAARRQQPYMGAGYRGIGTQISQNYAQGLGILNAESYDDGKAQQRSREMRLKQTTAPDPLMQFGITEVPTRMDLELRTDSDDVEKGSKRRKRTKADEVHEEDDEEARKKARGRPRVDTKDETAADRRRTQIRMAQRAYRHRKETTITSLEKQVQDLRGTNEEMSNIFMSLYDFAVSKGLLDREPEFGQQLRTTTDRFLALAKSASDEHEEHHDDPSHDGKSAPETGQKSKKARASPEKPQEPEPLSSQPWGGYFSKSESPTEEVQQQYLANSYGQRSTQRDLQIITRPTEDNASFPFDLMDLQSYRVEVPDVDNVAQNFTQTFAESFYPEAQLPLPNTYNYNEFSFARRIHRGALERAVRLITSKNPNQQRYNEVFGFCFLYESKESVEARLRRLLASSSKETLSEWKAPFVHVGGSGTFYPMHESDTTTDLMPKFRTGYSMGPFSPSVAPVQDNIVSQSMRLNLPGYEGEWFDPNDVEGYLRGRGLEIPPAADYVTAEIDLSILQGEASSPHSESTPPTISPKTPRTPVDIQILAPAPETDPNFSYDFEFAKPEGKAFLFPIGYADWDSNENVREASNIDPIFNTAAEREVQDGSVTERPRIEKRLVTVNVKILLDKILDHGVCLGRAPGFRPSDVNAAIVAAVSATF